MNRHETPDRETDAIRTAPIEILLNKQGQRFFYGTYIYRADADRDARVLLRSGRRVRTLTTDGGFEVQVLTGDGWVAAYGWLTV